MSRPPKSPQTPESAGQRRDEERWRTFADAWRRRLEAPPAIAPRSAAARVVARLAERDRRPWYARTSLLRPALAGAFACAVLLALSLRLTAPPAIPDEAGEVLIATTPGADELVLWLDDETPLHLTLGPSTGDAGDEL